MARGEKFPGVSERIKERLEALGYWKNDRPDVTRFARERGYLPSYVYKWLNEKVVPDYANLHKLAADLGVPMAWILFGDEEVASLLQYLKQRTGGGGEIPSGFRRPRTA